MDVISYTKAKRAEELVEQIIEGSIDTGVLQTNINSKLNDLEVQYASRLTNAESQLARKAKKHWIDVTDAPYNAKGDGITDDSQAIQAAIDASNGIVYIPEGTYYLGACLDIYKPIKILGSGDKTKLISNGGDYPKTYSVTYAGTNSNKTFRIYSKVKKTFTVTGDTFTAGTVDLTVSDTSGLVVGDTIYLMVGTNPYDGTEEYYRSFNKIKAINGTTVTLEIPIPYDIPTSTRATKFETFDSLAENIEISNMCIDIKTGGHVQDQLFLSWHSRSINIHDIRFNRVATAIEFLESEDCHARNIQIDYCTNYHGSAHPFNVWGVTNFSFRDINIVHMNNVTAFFGEATNMNGVIENVKINKTQDVPDTTYIYVFHFDGMSKNISVKNIQLTSKNKICFAMITNESTATFEDIVLEGSVRQFPLHLARGSLTINGVNYNQTRRATVIQQLKPNMNNTPAQLPRGLYKSFRIYSNYGNTYITGIVLEAGVMWLQTVDEKLTNTGFISESALQSYGDLFIYNILGNRRILTTTTADCPANAYIQMELEYYPESGYDVPINSQLLPYSGASAPTTGTWKVGDRVSNSAPAVGQPKGWVCTVAGSPGTWVSEGNL